MKIKQFQFVLFFCISFCFGDSFAQNASRNTVAPSISPSAPAPILGTEVFRFGTGLTTQLENQEPALFGFGESDQWHSIGRVNGAAQTVTGFRAQRAGQGLLLGFDGTLQSGYPTLGDPVIRWQCHPEIYSLEVFHLLQAPMQMLDLE